MTTKLATSNFSSSTLSTIVFPTVSSIVVTDSSYTATGATALLLTGGYIKITGSGFISGASVYIDSTPATSVTFVSSTQLNVQVAASASNTYVVYVVNPDGSVAIRVNGVNFSSSPTWVTNGTQSSPATINIQLAATSDSAIAYTLAAGSSLPSGLTLSSSGLLSGTVTGSNTVVYNFSIVATDLESQTSTQAFSITVSFNDVYFKYNTLLLNGEIAVTPFINDASTNNFAPTLIGDTKPNKFNPYSQGYYSNYFDGTGDSMSVPATTSLALGATDFTIEAWFYISGAQTQTYGHAIAGTYDAGSNGGWSIVVNRSTDSRAIGFVVGNAWQLTYYPSAYLNAGQWYHVAVVRSGATMSMYLNGTSVTSATYSTADSVSATFYVGSQGSTSCYFPGYISNVRMVKGTAVYTSAFTPPTSPLTGVANTQMLTCQSNRLIDNSSNNFAITKNGDTTVSSAHPFTTPTTASYNTQYSITFDGTGDYITVPSNSAFTLGTSDHTIEFWMYLTGAQGAYATPWKYSSGSTQQATNDYYFYAGSAGGASFGLLLGGSGSWAVNISNSASYTAALNTWTHVAITRSGNTFRLFANGTQVGSSGTYAGSIGAQSAAMIIGQDGASNFTTGNISNFRVVVGQALYTANFTPSTSPLTAVSGTQLLSCQDSTLKDNSTNNFTITSYGDAKPVTVSPFTMTTSNTTVTSLGSAYFDGTGDVINISATSALAMGTSDFTMEYWFYPGTNTTSNRMLGNGAGATYVSGKWAVWPYTASGKWAIDIYNVSSSATALNSTTSMSPNTWYHIAFTRSGNVWRLFVNGVQESTITNAASLDNGTSAQFTIGGSGFGTESHVGYISDFRLVKGTSLYTSNFLPPQIPLTPVTNTQLLTLQYNGGANNSGFIDNSNFNYPLTRIGNTTQGTFSPFSQTGWSNYFSANGSYLYVTNSNFNLSSATLAWTFECWIFPMAAAYFMSVGNGAAWGNSFAWDWGKTTANKFSLSQSNGGSAPVNFTSTNTYPGNVWYHVALTNDTSGVRRMFINGTLDGTQTYTAAALGSGTTFLLNSTYDNNGIGVNGATIYMSNVRVLIGTTLYTSAFTPSTVPLTPIVNTAILTCQSYRLEDNGPNNFALTSVGAPSVQAFSPFSGTTTTPTSYSNYFDGTGDYITLPSTITYTGDFTIECWFYAPVATITNYAGIFGGGSGNFVPFYAITSNKLECGIWGSAAIVTSSGSFNLNQWNHVALVRSGSTIRWYINGTQDSATATNAGTLTQTTPTIGASPTAQWNGYISNFRVVQGTALYTATFTPSTSPLTAISGTSLLTCKSNTIVDNSTNNITLTVNGNATSRPFNPFGQTITSGVQYTPAAIGGSAYFDGTGDYLQTANNISSFGTSNFTIECWFYSASRISLYPNVMCNNSSWAANGWNLNDRHNSATTGFSFWMYNYASGSPMLTGTTAVTNNQWYHVAVTRTGNVFSLFVNGKLDATSVTSTASMDAGVAKPIYIGGFGADSYINGYISSLRVLIGSAQYTSSFYPPLAPPTSAASPSAQLLLNFTNGGIIDYHASSNLETVGNTQLSTSVKKNGTSSIYFDGVGDYLGSPSTDARMYGDFTVECWLYKLSAGTDAGYTNIFAMGNEASGRIALLLQNNTLMYGTYGSGNESLGGNVPYTTWTHVAFVRVGSTVTGYVNGVATGTTLTKAGTLGNSAGFYIGALAGGTGAPLPGYIDDLRITRYARYTGTFTPPGTPILN